MPRQKRDPIEALRMKIWIAFYCRVADIACSGMELSLYIERNKASYSQYNRFVAGTSSPNTTKIKGNTYEKMIDALVERKIPTTEKERVERLFHSPIWSALQTRKIDEATEHEILSFLPFTIQKTIAYKSYKSTMLSLKRTIPAEKRIKHLEKLSSLEALAAIFLIIRQQRDRLKKTRFDDAHLHSAAFRMLISFLHEPSFYNFRHELLGYIRNNIVYDTVPQAKRMGLGFWVYPPESIDQILRDDAQIHKLAREVKIISGYEHLPSFDFLFNRADNRTELVEAMVSILDGRETDMNPLDAFYNELKSLRKRGKNSCNYPTLNFLHLEK